jgi:hypothetical protein
VTFFAQHHVRLSREKGRFAVRRSLGISKSIYFGVKDIFTLFQEKMYPPSPCLERGYLLHAVKQVVVLDYGGSTAGLEFELHFVDLGIRLHRNSHLFRPFLQMTPCSNW